MPSDKPGQALERGKEDRLWSGLGEDPEVTASHHNREGGEGECFERESGTFVWFIPRFKRC